MKRSLSLIAVIALSPLLLGMRAAPPKEDGVKAPAVACPMYAKLCPDGSSVSPQGPNCEVPACPGGDDPQAPPAVNNAPPVTGDENPPAVVAPENDEGTEESRPNEGCDDKDGCD